MCFGTFYFTEMLKIIIINYYQWLSAVFISGYQLISVIQLFVNYTRSEKNTGK